MSSTKPHPKGKDNPRGLRDLPFGLPEVTPAEKRRAKRIADALDEHYPDAHCELVYSNPHELLIATILSAQSTDAGVNKATPALFKKFKSPADFAASSPEEIEPYIKTIGLYRNKAKAIHSAMTSVVEDFGGEVPSNMDDLLTLRGVAARRPMSCWATPSTSMSGCRWTRTSSACPGGWGWSTSRRWTQSSSRSTCWPFSRVSAGA